MGRKTWHLAPQAEDGSLADYADGHDHEEGRSWRAWFPVIPGDSTDTIQEGWAEKHYRTVTMREALPFTGELRVIGFERGRSAARLIWGSRTGAVLPMFMVDIVDTLQRVELMDGWTEERDWEIVKRGANYGIRLVTP